VCLAGPGTKASDILEYMVSKRTGTKRMVIYHGANDGSPIIEENNEGIPRS